MANRFFPNYKSYIITSPFGVRIHPVTKIKKQHNGIDLVATNDGKTGQVDDIMAHTGGTVESEGYGISSGNFITIKVDEETTMVYYHMKARSSFKKGQVVKKGDIIGRVGQTGTATGKHLHWGIKKNNQWIDPAPYLNVDYPVKEEPIIPEAPAGFTQKILATITADALNVRKGPGTNYKIVSSLKKGDVVEILEHQKVNGKEWGRSEKGWISLSYTALEIKLDRIMATITLPTLVRGDKNDTVEAAQKLLMGEGYDLEGHGADGSFGGATERAVAKYQEKTKLSVTKVIDEFTWKKLLKV